MISFIRVKFRGITLLSLTHRIRMEIEAKANNRRLFFGENGGPLRLCNRRIDKGGPSQCYINMSFA